MAAALLLHPAKPTAEPPSCGRTPAPVIATDRADDGMILTAIPTSGQLLAGEADIAVTITAPAGRADVRPPVALAIVIDTSGSMSGEPMENAKAAAAKLVSSLDPSDAFAIVRYSSDDETIVPMTLATADAKAAAQAAIRGIGANGGTCISCGLNRGAAELQHQILQHAVERIMLISDGQATEGLTDKDMLAELASSTAAKGASISAVGVGIDFDEVTMMRIAETGRGNYYFVEDAKNLDAMFAKELGGLASTYAADVRLTVHGNGGVQPLSAYGYPATLSGTDLVVPVADLRAGETRKVVIHARVSGAVGAALASGVDLTWRRVSDGVGRRANTTALAAITADTSMVARTVHADAATAAEQAISAAALEEATRAYDERGAGAAQLILDKRVEDAKAKAYLPAASMRAIEADSSSAAQAFHGAGSANSNAGLKAKKTMRAKSYELAR